MKMMKKKSQTEMLGLAIVVLLVSIGLLFVVANVLKSTSSPGEKKLFSEQQLATNILGAILSTTAGCKQDKISTLMIDCGKGNVVSCDIENFGGAIVGGTDNICQYLQDVTNYMLDSTLSKWNKNYEFLAYVRRTDPLINITHNIGKCITSGANQYQYIQREFYYLPLHPGSMTIELGLCS